ncbi:hypothetical protein BDW60DRAFT_42817 [Aspergillus nidulans var. acristatus]
MLMYQTPWRMLWQCKSREPRSRGTFTKTRVSTRQSRQGRRHNCEYLRRAELVARLIDVLSLRARRLLTLLWQFGSQSSRAVYHCMQGVE